MESIKIPLKQGYLWIQGTIVIRETSDEVELFTFKEALVEITGNVVVITGKRYRVHYHDNKYNIMDYPETKPFTITSTLELLISQGDGEY